MEKQEIVQLLKEQLPALLEESPELERWIERLTAQRYANRQQTESRFDQLMEELRRDREAQTLRWEEEKVDWRNALGPSGIGSHLDEAFISKKCEQTRIEKNSMIGKNQ